MSCAMLFLAVAAGSVHAEARSDVVLQWNAAALEAIRLDRSPPPVAARNLALVHLAVFDAINAVTLTHRPYRVAVSAPADAALDVVAMAAAHRALVVLYPKQADRLDARLRDSLAGLPSGAGRERSLALGRLVADRILAARAADDQLKKQDYRPAPAVGIWRPTPPAFAPALLPQWANLATFCGARAADLDPGPPPALTSAAYAVDLNEVKRLGAINSEARIAAQANIAWFWEDGEGTVTPPGHWNRIAAAVARQRRHTPEQNARLLALLNLALADAAIVCWDCKFKYGLWRPIDAIRHADEDDNPATDADKTWTPLLVTPPFPSYTSGHSTFSGAAAAVLADFCGTDEVRFDATSEGLPGMTRSFTSFRAAAEEAGRSRIYGGIHFECDNRHGLQVGRRLGEMVSRTMLQPIK